MFNNPITSLKVAIMTSGGDAPGMNMLVTSLLRFLYANHYESYIIHSGFLGLVNDQIEKFDYNQFYEFVDCIFCSGTRIKSSRLPTFAQLEVQQKAVANLKKHHIDLVLLLGGDGSYKGGKVLIEHGFNVIALPCTIDNDIGSTQLTVGFDSAFDLILKHLYAIRNTARSFESFCLVEIMGRACSDLTLSAGMACFADGVITKDNPWTVQDFVQRINLLKKQNKHWGLFLVTEKYYSLNGQITYQEIIKQVFEQTGVHMKFDSIGYAQRGAQPTAWELKYAFLMTHYVVNTLIKNREFNCIVSYQNGHFTSYEYDEGLKITKHNDVENVQLVNDLATLDFFTKK